MNPEGSLERNIVVVVPEASLGHEHELGCGLGVASLLLLLNHPIKPPIITVTFFVAFLSTTKAAFLLEVFSIKKRVSFFLCVVGVVRCSCL